MNKNIDDEVVRDFGKEWSRFDQSGADPGELQEAFEGYFSVFPWNTLPPNAVGFDLGCGSGRWARLVAPRVGELHCIDPSEKALAVAKVNLQGLANCKFHLAGVDDIPLPDESAPPETRHVTSPPGGMRSLARLKRSIRCSSSSIRR